MAFGAAAMAEAEAKPEATPEAKPEAEASRTYNRPSYKSNHDATYYDEPITIKGKTYRPDVSFLHIVILQFKLLLLIKVFFIAWFEQK